MKITLDPGALKDLDDIFGWISKDNPVAAYDMIARIEARIEILAMPGLKHMGRPGLDEGTHELIEYPYIIVYEVFESQEEIVVWAVLHGAMPRKPGEGRRSR